MASLQQQNHVCTPFWLLHQALRHYLNNTTATSDTTDTYAQQGLVMLSSDLILFFAFDRRI